MLTPALGGVNEIRRGFNAAGGTELGAYREKVCTHHAFDGTTLGKGIEQRLVSSYKQVGFGRDICFDEVNILRGCPIIQVLRRCWYILLESQKRSTNNRPASLCIGLAASRSRFAFSLHRFSTGITTVSPERFSLTANSAVCLNASEPFSPSRSWKIHSFSTRIILACSIRLTDRGSLQGPLLLKP